MSTETWYVLEDGTYASPADCSPDKAGVLKHSDGRKVAMRGDVPSSRSVDPDEERAKAAKAAKKPAKDMDWEYPKKIKEMKAEGGAATYKTR